MPPFAGPTRGALDTFDGLAHKNDVSETKKAKPLATTTPVDLVIHPRDMSFRWDSAGVRWWMGNDPVATAYYNTFSAAFPQVERYFIDSVRRYRDLAGPELQQQIAAFIAQESMHSREHVAFNRVAVRGGYDLTNIELFLKKKLDWARALSPIKQVASTAALEHFTTILSHEAVGNPGTSKPPRQRFGVCGAGTAQRKSNTKRSRSTLLCWRRNRFRRPRAGCCAAAS
jgi:hypothetical protein